MRKVLIYTENYQRGGGNQYLVDVINNVPLDSLLFIASNIGGVYKEDFGKIKRPYTYIEIPIASLPILYTKFKSFTTSKLMLFCFKIIIFFLKNVLFILFKKKNFRHFSNLLEEVKPNLVISCNGGFPGGLSCLDCIEVSKPKNISTWLTVVSMPQKKSFIDTLYSKTLTDLDRLIVNSQNIADQFMSTRKVSKDKIFVLHNCLSNDAILKKPLEQIRYTKDLPEFKLGYVGRIEQAKGIFYLINAFELLQKKFSNLKLILVGSGRDLKEAKSQCDIKQLSSKIEFIGHYPGEINEIIRTFDLFVFPSLWEGLPYSVLEAMANSKVVISTNVGGIPEIITNDINGFLISAADSEGLCNKIKFVLENSDDNNRIAANGLYTIQNKFSENNFKRNMETLFSVQ